MSTANFKIESGGQLLARLTKKPDLENFYPALFQHGPKNGEIIEVFSDNCPSSFLMDIICEALIQTKLNGAPAGVLIFNTDGNIDYEVLFYLLKKKIHTQMQKNEKCTDSTIDNSMKETVANLHVVDIYDVTQYYTTLYNLENILVEHSNVSLIIFNTLTAFYWSEQGYKITKMDSYLKSLLNIIQKITKDYKTICLYTRPEYFCTNKDNTNVPAEIDHQIQVLDNSKWNYQVIIKSTSYKATGFFKIINKELKWL